MSKEGKKRIAQQIALPGEKNKGSPSNKSSDIFQKNQKNQQFILFNFTDYPFQNVTQSHFIGCKTVLRAEHIKGNLQRLVSLNHQNIIQIERVAKSNVKLTPDSKPETFYSIYYELVPFSLKKLASSTKAESAHFPIFTASDLCNKLVEVCEYLMEADIYLTIRLEDIGVAEDGDIKVYVPPLTIGKEDNRKVSKRNIMYNIDRIMTWWRTTSSSRSRKPSRMSEDGPISNSLGFESEGKDILKPKISTSFIEKGNRQVNECSSQSKTIKVGSSTPDKIKRLEDELRKIKAVMAEKMKGRVYMGQREIAGQASKAREGNTKNREGNRRAQLEDSSGDSGSKNQQSIQQNINCINIYNNHLPGALKESQERIKNFQTHQIYSFKIESNRQEQIPQKNQRIVHLNTFPEDLHPLEDEDEDLSIDTYEMDLGEEFDDNAPPSPEPFRMSLKNPKRDNSERNYSHNKVEDQSHSKMTSNQVVATKRVTESAGPLQFKNFVLQHIKPQFLAKRSNIYEDPGQYDSEKSHSMSKKVSNYIKELTEAGKSAASYNEKSSSAKRSREHQVESFTNNKNKQQLKQSQGLKANKTQESTCVNEKRFMKNQRSEAVIASKIEEERINEKVKAAVEKTRNAIALLNRVKAAKKIQGHQ